jgi:glycosyltransferase involved in cell wall biosynthesis
MTTTGAPEAKSAARPPAASSGERRPDSARQQPLVSIVTVVRDRAGSLERAMASVFCQTYRPLEYVVIDGGSTDGSLEVIRRHADRLAYWISEPDRGISDAFNKGVAASTGSLIGLLNADDWMEPLQIERAVDALERSGAGFAFGDLIYHDPTGRPLHRIAGDPEYARVIAGRMPEINHPSLLARREVHESVGPFDLRYRAAMDYDWLLRAHLAGYRGIYEPGIVAHMTLAGVSDRGYLRALAEVRAIAIRHGQPAARAWALYGYRALKGAARRAIHALAPEPAYARLRGLINPSYQPYRSRGDE